MTSLSLTDDHIATLVDVARAAGTDISPARRGALAELIAAGYVAEAAPGADTSGADTTAAAFRYRLTAAGQSVLDARGVGANES